MLAVWAAVWVFFLLWPFLKNPSGLRVALEFLRSDAEGRRALVYGEEFYEFLRFCQQKLPAGSTFHLVGIDYAAVEKVRAFYVLYPCLVSENPDYLLVYKKPGYEHEGTHLFAALDSARFILKKASSPPLP